MDTVERASASVSGSLYSLKPKSSELVVPDRLPIELASLEFGILDFFDRHPRERVSKEDIASGLRAMGYTLADATVPVYISSLRKKLAGVSMAGWLDTKWGSGYAWFPGGKPGASSETADTAEVAGKNKLPLLESFVAGTAREAGQLLDFDLSRSFDSLSAEEILVFLKNMRDMRDAVSKLVRRLELASYAKTKRKAAEEEAANKPAAQAPAPAPPVASGKIPQQRPQHSWNQRPSLPAAKPTASASSGHFKRQEVVLPATNTSGKVRPVTSQETKTVLYQHPETHALTMEPVTLDRYLELRRAERCGYQSKKEPEPDYLFIWRNGRE